MLNLISRDRWVFAVPGVAAIPFGIIAIAGPGNSAVSMRYVGVSLAIAFGFSSQAQASAS